VYIRTNYLYTIWLGDGYVHELKYQVNSQVSIHILEEVSQAKARSVMSALVFLFFVCVFYLGKINYFAAIFVGGIFIFSLIWQIYLKHDPGDYIWRRRFISLFDICVVSFVFYLSGEWGSIFYFLYLWIIVGNGMRFGVQSLMEVMTMGVVGFSIVFVTSEYWQQNIPAGTGLLLGIIILPSFYMVLIKRLYALNEKLQIELNNARYVAIHDGMTNLLNREYFFQRVKEKMIEAQRYKEKFAVIFIDLDGFKAINDTFGHHIGDKLLKVTANRIRLVARKSDLVARLGGDEFALILHETNGDEIDMFASRLLTQIEKVLLIENTQLNITASIGISLFPDHGDMADLLVKAADKAMYQSKRSGKNQFTKIPAAVPVN